MNFAHSPPYGAEVNEWSHTFTPPCVPSWCGQGRIYILQISTQWISEDWKWFALCRGKRTLQNDIYFRDTRENVTSFATTGKVRPSRKPIFSKLTEMNSVMRRSLMLNLIHIEKYVSTARANSFDSLSKVWLLLYRSCSESATVERNRVANF